MENCMPTPGSMMELYKDSQVPVVLITVADRKMVWHNESAERFFSELKNSDDACELFAVSRKDERWDVLVNGGEVKFCRQQRIPERTVILSMLDGETALGHLVKGSIYTSEGADRLIQALSNQIRTPLASLFSLISNLDCIDENGGELAEAAIRMNRNCYRILRAWNDYAAYCRASAGCEIYDMETVDAAALVGEMCKAVQFFAISLGIPFEYDIHDHFAYIRVDPVKYTVALLNLLLNSFKYTSERNRVKLELIKANDEVRVIVSDHGAGMSKETLEHAFEPFYACTPDTSYPQSAGLALALVKNQIEKMDGKVTLMSVEDEGTVAMVTMPEDGGEDPNVTVCESSVDMLADLFSPVYIVMADIAEPPVARLPFQRTGAEKPED